MTKTQKFGRVFDRLKRLVGFFDEKYFYCWTDTGCFTTVARTKKGAIREVEKRTGWKVKAFGEPCE